MGDFFGFDLASFIRAAGYLGVFAFVFAESGLLLGFFLPGDSLLFTAGFLASQGFLDISLLVIGCFLAAAIGDSVGYGFGAKFGVKIFQRPSARIFNGENLIRTQRYFDRHGGKTIIMARFIPGVRTLAPILAGVGAMHYQTFLVYNIVGAALWAIGVPLAGFFLGRSIPNIDRYLVPIVVGIIILSLLPSLFHLLANRERRRQLMALVTGKREAPYADHR